MQAVSARIDENIQQQLLEYCQAALMAQKQELNQAHDNHPAIDGGPDRQWIVNSSVADLEKLRTEYQKRKDGAKLTESIRQVIHLRNEIDTLTTRIRKLT